MTLHRLHPVVVSVLGSITLLCGLSTEYSIKVVPILAGNLAMGSRYGNCTTLPPPRQFTGNQALASWTFVQDKSTSRVRAVSRQFSTNREDAILVEIAQATHAPRRSAPIVSPPRFLVNRETALLSGADESFSSGATAEMVQRTRSQAKLGEYLDVFPSLDITHEAFIFEPLGWVQWYSLIGSVVYRTSGERTFVLFCRRRISGTGFGRISSAGVGVFQGLEEGRDAQICDVR